MKLSAELSFVIVVAVIIIAVWVWFFDEDYSGTATSPSSRHLMPIDVVKFSMRCREIESDKSLTGLQKDKAVSELWNGLTGKKIRWAGTLYEVRSSLDGLEAIVTFPVPEGTGKSFLMVFLDQPDSYEDELVKYNKGQSIWMEGWIPDDSLDELESAVDRAIRLPGRISPRSA